LIKIQGNKEKNNAEGGNNVTSGLENVMIGMIQLIIAIILAVVSLYIGFAMLGKLTNNIDEEKELAKGNTAVGILVASIFVSIAIVVQSGIAGISAGLRNAVAGNIYSLVASVAQLVIGIILAVAVIYMALNIFDKLTKGIDEFEEIRKGNVAVALEMAGVIVATALIVQSGVIGITSSLF
jgi:uncharacterized membrane protein YjfL (UPF0719 family)